MQEKILVMPYDYAEDEHYYVEKLGTIPTKRIYSFIKRLFDIVASLAALVILAIPMFIIAILIKASSPGTIIYKQKRCGLNHKEIMVYKFRTMYKDAEKFGVKWSEGEKDERITPIGHALRKFRLDELPQFVCVLNGSMSLIGPRPERECFYNEFEKNVHGFSERLKVKPGITGLAQINGGYDLAPHEKVLYDIEYIKSRSVLTDIKIIIKTIKVVFLHENAK